MKELCDYQHRRLKAKDAEIRASCLVPDELPPERYFKFAALDLGVRTTRLYRDWAARWAQDIRKRQNR